jgi:hypothetical protein
VKKPKHKLVMDFKHYWICYLCAAARGGKMPENHCCTVTQDKCPYCNVVCTVVPHVDFIWPGEKKLRVWD